MDRFQEEKPKRSHKQIHFHGTISPGSLATEKGIWAVKISFAGLILTALFQVGIVWLSGSVALLADTIHNFGDAATAIPLGFAFLLARKNPDKRFTYGYGKAEDIAGVIIVILILLSALFAGYESINRLFNPQPVNYLGAVGAASLIGFAGNELVARFRIKVGEEIGSAALVADGYHARVDGYTSLAVLFGALGIWLGYPLADPIIGFMITLAILRLVRASAKTILFRILDGIDPEIVEEIRFEIGRVEGVADIQEIRVRWIGHSLYAEVNIAVDSKLSVEEGHKIAMAARHEIMHRLNYISKAVIHVDPLTCSGEELHKIPEHEHDGFPPHGH
ncbi:MAG: cation diffusion facilitator family transporter [Methanosarcinaceae archaeon]|nr:cation diffusion facilitator family transporter [Methanosarcinaceae archaeon]